MPASIMFKMRRLSKRTKHRPSNTRRKEMCKVFDRMFDGIQILSNTTKHDQTQSNTIKQHQTWCSNGKGRDTRCDKSLRPVAVQYAECGYFTLLFVIFCEQRQRNEQIIITHSYTAIVLVAVTVEVCSILNFLKPNKRQNNEQSNELKTKSGSTKRQLRVQKTSLL